jgi:hypothetical protein
MPISGEEMGQLSSLIVKAYSEDDFTVFLKTKCERDFDNIKRGERYTNQVFNLIEDFDRWGQIPFLKFISDIRDGRPENERLRIFCDNILTEASRNKTAEAAEKHRQEEMLKDYLMEVTKSFKEGKLIVFLGSGINYAPDKTKLPPSDIDIARHIAISLGTDGDSLASRVDIPCQICPVTLDKRPKISEDPKHNLHCPIWDKIYKNNPDKQEIDKNEQNLAFARLQMRYLSDNFTRGVLSEWLRDECNNPYEPNEIQQALAKIACQQSLLILTTNYDVGLEKAFEEKKLNFDVIYYFIRKSDFTGSFWYKSYYYKDDNENNDQPGTEKLPDGFGLAKPIIFKLYGGVLYDAGEEYDSFAISESHLINYLIGQSPKNLLPTQITKQLEKSDILFLGCNPNDTELLALLHRFFPAAFMKYKGKEPQRAWLVNHLNFKPSESDTTYKNRWIGRKRHLIDQCSSEDFLSKLQENLTKTEVVS